MRLFKLKPFGNPTLIKNTHSKYDSKKTSTILQKAIIVFGVLSIVYGLATCTSSIFSNQKEPAMLIAPIFILAITVVLYLILFFKKILKKSALIALLISIISAIMSVTVYVGVYTFSIKNSPCNQPGTSWISGDQSIIIKIDDKGNGSGEITVGETNIEFLYEQTSYYGIELYFLNTDKKYSTKVNYPDERWIGDYKNEDFFSITVKETTCFKPLQQINFFKISEERQE